MDRHQFHNVIREYRSIMECCTPADSWMDWRSDVYVHGTWRCVRIADHYLRPGSRVLDLGCGLGLFTILLSRYGHTVVGVDIDVGGRREEVKQSYRAGWGSCRDELENPKMMTDCWKELARNYGAEFRPYDGEHLPFDDGWFDAVVAHAVLEHIHPDKLGDVIEEVERVTAEQGFFFVFRTPRPEAYLERLASRLHLPVHELTYTAEEIAALVEQGRFDLRWRGVTDTVPSFLPAGLRLYNLASPVLIGLDDLLLRTGLSEYAHHMALVFERRAEED